MRKNQVCVYVRRGTMGGRDRNRVVGLALSGAGRKDSTLHPTRLP